MSRFEKFPEEHAIIGRLLTRYTDLELSIFNCVQVMAENFDQTFRTMFGERGESKRIKAAVQIGLPIYEKLGMKSEFEQSVDYMRHCLKIRNNYAHNLYWDDLSGKLAVFSLEDLNKDQNKIRDFSGVRAYYVDVDVLAEQEQFFVNTEKLIGWVNYRGRYLCGNIHMNTVPKPDKFIKPPLKRGMVPLI